MADSSRHKKILQVVPKSPTWGFDLFEQVAAAYSNAGHDVTTVFLSGQENEAVRNKYPGTVKFLQLNHKQSTWRFKALSTLLTLCRDQHFDATVCHHYKPSAIMAMVDRFCPIDRLFMVNHNPGNLRRKGRRLIIRHLFSNRWTFLTVSDWVRRDFLEHAQTISPERVKTIYNCIDIEAITRSHLETTEARKQLGLPENEFIFGNIHRLDKSKGHDYLIEAFARASDQMPGAHLAIIGGGDRKTLLEQIAHNHGVGDHVHLLGLIPDASKYIRAFDVFVIPSLHEGFGLGLLEGMCGSLPVIASTGGALLEVVGDTGLHFPPGDTDALAQQLLKVYSMPPEERQHMGNTCYQRLKNNFSKEQYHQNFLRLLD